MKDNKMTIFLIITLVIIVIMGCFLCKFVFDKKSLTDKIDNLNKEIVKLKQENSKQCSSISSALDDYVFELNSKNKYTIITDLRWKTMLNDGGSNSSLYYQIDLDNLIVKKIEEEYHANLNGTPSKYIKELYTKKINDTLKKELENLLNDVLTKEDVKDNNYDYFTVLNLNTTKNIYNLVRQ